MSWHKKDDAASFNPKLAQLTDEEIRALDYGLWAYCARRRNGGHFTAAELVACAYITPRGPRNVTPKQLEKYLELDLVDTLQDGSYLVHDWDTYNPQDPTGAERVARHRAKRAAQAAGLTVTDTVTPTVTKPVTDAVTKPLPRAQASRPVPVLEPLAASTSTVDGSPAADDLDVIGARLTAAGWNSRQLDLAAAEPLRAIAWLEHAEGRTDVRNPGAVAWRSFEAGAWPPGERRAPAEPRAVDPSAPCPGCGAKIGAGHLDDCPKVAEAVAAAAVAEPVESEEEREERLASMVTGAAGLLRSLRPEPPSEEAA